MAVKRKTNEQVLRALLRDLSPIEAALLRERIMHVMQLTQEDILKNPEKYTNFFVNPQMYSDLCSKVLNHIGFEDEK